MNDAKKLNYKMDILATISNLSIIQLLILGFVVIALQKSGIDVIGFIQKLLRKNGDDKTALAAKLDEIENNHLHTINETLLRIEKKLEEVHENTVIIRTKQKNGN